MTDMFRSDYPAAVYRPQFNAKYVGNPFIEALPPICDVDGAIQSMINLVEADDMQRAAPSQERLHLIPEIESFVQPLGHHIDLFNRISMLLRQGYVGRNPVSPDFLRDLGRATNELREDMLPAHGDKVSAAGSRRNRLGGGSGLTLIGPSGVGKTTAVEAVLRSYDQVIVHPKLDGVISSVAQVVWLKLSCPPDGSIKGLCIDFFVAIDELLGTNYYEIYVKRTAATVDNHRVNMGRIAFIHGLGLLVIDEVQNLSTARSGGATLMMNFFKLLRDVMRVPLLAIGTPEAEPILSGDMQVARRNSGLPRMDRMKNDREFELFCQSLFFAQYLREPVEHGPFVDFLYQCSQGIADVVVKMFMLAQVQALSVGSERLSLELLARVYASSFTLLHPFLDNLRGNKPIHGTDFDEAMAGTDLQTRTALGLEPRLKAKSAREDAVARSTIRKPAVVGKAIGGVAKRKPKGSTGPKTGSLLVGIVRDGATRELSPHDALVAEGWIRQIHLEEVEA